MKVLFGVEGTTDVPAVVTQAVERARDAGDELVVAVVESEEATADVETLEEAVRTTLTELDCQADVRVLSGHAGSRLTELAEREDFDRLVIEGGHRTPLGKISLTSTMEFVILNAELTVTLLR